MADKDNKEDEYQFEDLDTIDTTIADDDKDLEKKQTKTVNTGTIVEQGNPKRKVLIIVGGLCLLFLLYEAVTGLFFNKKEIPPVKEAKAPIPIPPPKPAPVVVTEVKPVPVVTAGLDSESKQKIMALEASQEALKREDNTLRQQVENIGNTVTTLNAQVEKLSTVVNSLSMQVASQSNQIEGLIVRLAPKPVVKRVKVRIKHHVLRYAIRAVIPGRAWLIASNGSTLTVRKGTPIAGYGIVRAIDAVQGRVLTSSGRVIRFSLDDS